MQVKDSNFYAGNQQTYNSIKIVAVFVLESIGIAPECCLLLQVEVILYCVEFLTYKNNNNTYKYIVFFNATNNTYNGNGNNIYLWT